MDTPLSARLSQLKSMIDALADQRDLALRSLEEMKAENADLRREISSLQAELQKRLLDIEYLQVSHKIADSPRALAESRAIVHGLIKRVDKAIRLISEDPGI